MNGLGVFLALSGAALAYVVATSKGDDVRTVMVASRRYRVTHLGPNRWRIERIDESSRALASADYEYGKDLSNTVGSVVLLQDIASDMLVFPADLFR